ncbi:plastoquinol terminal oxidase [Nodosilinea sp. LEGE 07298]|uniref:alternative oxidase n=1 Tax=Nodosilinea sp. LEGE 07298 TaxID=2777970 RepID=UPI00187E7F4E|nr:alternative oxidase [Nodosilinea sp. LEGE 07298]MBE9109238.1 plastoquinol terminal oxidase [Nodosilinea sp. LEGE 07298]
MTRLLVGILVFVINTVYANRPYPRFYVLETVARVPYFSYLSVLHLYETLGLWRKADWLKIHFAESWNELHHLLIMEELGGANFWGDRLLARTAALVYYWVIAVLYLVDARSAYHFMELVEGHAYATYDKFLKTEAATLKTQPAPAVAVKYYRDGDLYMFDEFQTAQVAADRRPQVNTLYDVFVAIRDDEMEHVKTMVACQHPNAQQELLSPHTAAVELTLLPIDEEIATQDKVLAGEGS